MHYFAVLHFNTPMPNIFSAFSHCAHGLCCPFAASQPHQNCLGLGQQIFSSTPQNSPCHFSPSLHLHLWPLLASFFTFSATFQPLMAAFFICFGMKTWLQLVGNVVWRGRGGEAAGLIRVGSKAPLSLGTPASQERWWLSWLNTLELGRRGDSIFLFLWICKYEVKPDPELCTTWVLGMDHSWTYPSAFSSHSGDPPVLWSKQHPGEDVAMGHLESPAHSWDFAETSWAKPCVTRNHWNDFKRAKICRSRSPGKPLFSSPWKRRKLWACISHLIVPRPISR